MEATLYNNILTLTNAAWTVGIGPKEYGQYLLNKRGYSHKRTNRKNKK